MSSDAGDPTVRVEIALRHGLIREGVESYLADQSARILLAPMERGLPADVVITDKLPEGLPTRIPQTPIVLCASLQTRIDVVRAFAHGAQACVSVNSGYQHLMLAIEWASERRQYLCPTLEAVMHKPGYAFDSELTSRESDVMQWISVGYSSKQIGRILGISPYTVDTHRRSIMLKLDLHSVAELTRFAITRERASQAGRSPSSR